MFRVTLSRRRLLLLGTVGFVSSAALAACGQQAAPSAPAATAAAPTPAPAAPAATAPAATSAPSAPAATAQPAAPATQAAPSTAKAATITIWPRGATDQVVFEKIGADFKIKHPEITVQLQPLPDNGYVKFLAAVAAGSGPDSLVVNTPAGVPMIYKGAFLSLQPYMMGSPDVQDNLKLFAKPALDSYTAKGQLYAIPVTNESQVIFYNADLLTKAGLDLPETFEDDPKKSNESKLEAIQMAWLEEFQDE